MSVNKYELYIYKFLNLSLCFIRNLRTWLSLAAYYCYTLYQTNFTLIFMLRNIIFYFCIGNIKCKLDNCLK